MGTEMQEPPNMPGDTDALLSLYFLMPADEKDIKDRDYALTWDSFEVDLALPSGVSVVIRGLGSGAEVVIERPSTCGGDYAALRGSVIRGYASPAACAVDSLLTALTARGLPVYLPEVQGAVNDCLEALANRDMLSEPEGDMEHRLRSAGLQVAPNGFGTWSVLENGKEVVVGLSGKAEAEDFIFSNNMI